MKNEKFYNQYKVTVTSKYKDFDGTERSSTKTKMVYAKSEQLAINQVVKTAKQNVKMDINNKPIGQWNNRASQFVNGQEVSAELIKENVLVID